MKVSCECFVEYLSAQELEGVVFDNLPRPFLQIGGGSNLLFTGDFPGTVFHSKIRHIKYIDLGLDEVPVMVGSGVVFDDLVAELCGHGLWGAENLSGIPGEVGAAAVQNVGAYGVEFKDIVSGVVCYDLKERRRCRFKKDECHYGYRSSIFKEPDFKGRYIVENVLIRVSRKPTPHIEYRGISEALGGKIPQSPSRVREAVLKIRSEKLPDPKVLGSAGSFFKNPVITAEQFAGVPESGDMPHFELPEGRVKLSAAWLIDHCGLKGESVGGARVYEKQPLVIVNASGSAVPSDVMELEARVVEKVKEKYGVLLQREVEYI